MARRIAKVRLALGQVAFYDPLTRIHLTLGNPTADILEDMNTARIKRAVLNKILILVTGSFEVEKQACDYVEITKTVEPKPEVIEKEEPVCEEIKEAKVERVVVENVEEEVTDSEENTEADTEIQEKVTESKSKRRKKKEE